MRNPVDLAHLFADIILRSIDIWRVDDDRLVEHWDERNLLEVFQPIGAIPMQGGATS